MKTSRSEQQEIDASAKWPVLVFFTQALAWLLVGGALQLIGAFQLHTPGFLADCEWFTHGRVTAAGTNALVYGWGFNAAFGVALWLMARLSAAALRSGGWLIVAGKFWNVGVALGLLGILTGASTSYELLEMPRFVTHLLFGAYALMGVWVVTTYSVRNTEYVYASQWYLFAAVFLFPWLFLAAQAMLFFAPVRGTVQAVVNVWYVNGVYGLWFVPVALAIAYYFIPKILGRPVYNYYLAAVGFWWLLACTAFTAGARLIGGPVPAWVPTLGIVANYLAVPAVVIVLANLLGGFAGRYSALRSSVALRFIFLSVLAFAAWSVLNLLLSSRDLAATAQFTLLAELRDTLAFYGCFSTAVFGAAYFLLPRLTGFAWRSQALVSIHWICTAVGVILLVVCLGGAGWVQGRLLNSATVPFTEVVQQLTPWFVARSLVFMLLLAGHVAFLINFAWMGLASVGICSGADEPAVFTPPPAMEGPSS
ncbi:MAG: cbb3-type cytochrome c oxidase subunit I [Opitutales bacterium]